MRERFHGELDALGEQLAGMCAMAAEALRLANRILFERDRGAASSLAAVEAKLNAARDECEETARRLLVLQAPKAGELRTVMAAVYSAERIERMGDLAEHIAETAKLGLPAAAYGQFSLLRELTGEMADELIGWLGSAEGGSFAALDYADERVDAVYGSLMRFVTGPEWAEGVAAAVTVTLLARFYERFADQIVSVARRLDFARTGDLPV